MVTQNQQALTVDRAVKVARLFAQRERLAPPVDIVEVISQFASVEYDDIPSQCDALSVRGSDGSTVIVSAQLKEPYLRGRLRFTLAHELAHLILPWQIGTFFCHPNQSVAVSDYLTKMLEAEANRFASELLVPQAWVRALAASHSGSDSDFVESVKVAAGVSSPTALFACIGVLPPCRTLAIVDENSIIQYIATTSGSFWTSPEPGEPFPYRQIEAIGGAITQRVIGGRVLIAVLFNELINISKPLASSSDILRQIIESLGLSDRQRIYGMVNGVVGALYGNARQLSTIGGFLGALKQRFAGRRDLDFIMTHPRFDDFLNAKAHELAGKRNSK